MSLNKYRLGDFLIFYDIPCGKSNLTIFDVSGVNSDKEFFEPSKQVGTDTSKYKNVPPDYFACNLMHVGRDKVLPIALNHSNKTKIVSPAYTVFKIKKETTLIKEYFFMMLKSKEQDRYFWFHTDSSVRDGMSLDDFCNLEVELPPLSVQQKYVNIYNAMLANQQSYEKGLDDLKLIYEILLEKYKREVLTSALGKLITEVDVRNVNGSIISVQGVNKEKKFIPSVANSSDITKYRVVSKGQFACNLMHVGRDVSIPIALNNGKPIIVSPAYTVFKVDNTKIIPEFLIMWLSRQETDRRAWFMSDTNVRSGMEKSRFYEMEIPIPSIKEQQTIANLFNTITLRKDINEHLKAEIKNICPILIKGSIEEGNA